MLRCLSLLLTLAVLTVAFVLPVQAQGSSGCASTERVQEVCFAPEAAPVAELRHICAPFTLPEETALPTRLSPPVAQPLPVLAQGAQGRSILPDHRPPRA